MLERSIHLAFFGAKFWPFFDHISVMDALTADVTALLTWH